MPGGMILVTVPETAAICEIADPISVPSSKYIL